VTTKSEDLDRHRTPQLHLLGEVDLPHAPFAEERDDLVRSDSRAGGEHEGRILTGAKSGEPNRLQC
jgi:hypothetical protein